MPPSLDDSSFIIVGDVFEGDDDGSLSMGEQSSNNNREQVNRNDHDMMGGTLILPSASTPETFTPPSSVDSDIPSLQFQRKTLLIPDEDDDMEGIDDPLDFSNVDAPSKFAYEEEEPVSKASWKTILQDSFSTNRLQVLFCFVPILLIAIVGIAAYAKHVDTLRLRDLEMANQMREREHQLQIMQLQQEIETLKKKQQQSIFTSAMFTDPPLAWFKPSSETSTRSIIEQWNELKSKAITAVDYARTVIKQDIEAKKQHRQYVFETIKNATTWGSNNDSASSISNLWGKVKKRASTTADQLRTTAEKELEEAKKWWAERQHVVVEQLSRCTDEEASPDHETGTEATDTSMGKSLMPSKKTILVSAVVISAASVLLGTAMDNWFGNSPSRLADYETFDPFGVPLADFVE